MANLLHMHKNQTGLTLIELMVAMLIGLFLMAGVINIMTASRQTFRFNEGMTVIQENGRYAIDILERTIRLTGYPFQRSQGGLFSFDTAKITDGLGDSSDTVSVQYESNLGDLCQGLSTSGAVVQNHFFNVNAGNLRCDDEVLVDGVDFMQIQYGIDTDDDFIPNLFVNRGDVNAGIKLVGTADWNNVISIRIAILINSINPIQQPAERSYILLDRSISFSDGLTRRVFTTTIPLRNRAISNI